ncbi:MAG: hypothetical protein IPN33_03155 [Saprospiraceae bacterium]|nr:hypothetical protein [Saprospiraceae bacterium]
MLDNHGSGLPPVRQQLTDLLDGMIGLTSQDVAQPQEGVDLVFEKGTQQRVYHSGALGGLMRTGE